MRPDGCGAELLRRLAAMPFLDRLEMAAVSGRSRGAVYEAVGRLEDAGLVESVAHAAVGIPPTRRYCLTAAGLHTLARGEGMTVDELLVTCPVIGAGTARADGETRRRRGRIPPRLRHLQRRVPHALQMVPGHADGRGHDAPGRQDTRRRQAGADRRPNGLRQAPVAATARNSGPAPSSCSCPTTCGSGTPAGSWPDLPPSHSSRWKTTPRPQARALPSGGRRRARRFSAFGRRWPTRGRAAHCPTRSRRRGRPYPPAST